MAFKHPDFFLQLIKGLDVSPKALEVMRWRYIEKKKFKEIPQIVFVESRQVFRIHKEVIDKLINL